MWGGDGIDLAKVSPHILCAEKFALHIGTFFVSKYAHIHKAHVSIEQLKWSRIRVGNEDGQVEDHSHAFLRDGEEKRMVKVLVDATAGKDKLIANVSAGISDLLGMCIHALSTFNEPSEPAVCVFQSLEVHWFGL